MTRMTSWDDLWPRATTNGQAGKHGCSCLSLVRSGTVWLKLCDTQDTARCDLRPPAFELKQIQLQQQEKQDRIEFREQQKQLLQYEMEVDRDEDFESWIEAPRMCRLACLVAQVLH